MSLFESGGLMKKEAFQEIAKHFAESIKVNLRFEEGASPATNGTEIILPTEMSENYLDETLGALLHETNHIRYTDFGVFKSWDELTRVVGNGLEDIRIDNKAMHIYPNSRCFYMSLVNDVLSRCKDKLLQEHTPIKILKGLILNSVGIDLKDVYGQDKDWELILEKTTTLQGTVNEVIKCDDTESIYPYVVKVIKEIFGEQEKKQQATGKPEEEECNGGNGASGEGEEGSQQQSNSSGSPTQSSNSGSDGKNGTPSLEDAGEVFEEYTELLEKESDLKEKYDDTNDRLKEIEQERKSNQRSAKSYDTKRRRLEREAYNRPLTAEEISKKDKYTANAKERWEKLRNLGDEMNKQYQERNQVSDEISKFKKELDGLKKEINKAVNDGFSKTGNCNLLGFDALDNDKLIDEDYVHVDYNPTLDEIIKEVLILKQEEFQTEETGKLNPRYYHEIYTDTENLFQEKEEHKIKTMVSLVFDVSGSMNGSRVDLVLHAINTLGNSFSKAVAQGAPGEMRMFAFGSDVVEAIQTIENFKPINYEKYAVWQHLGGGSTNLSDAVNHVVREVSNDPEYRNIIIILTDAEVNSSELQEMVNNISTGDAKVMYIAIDSRLNTPEARELFGENNITCLEEANQILQNVMFKGLQTLN